MTISEPNPLAIFAPNFMVASLTTTIELNNRARSVTHNGIGTTWVLLPGQDSGRKRGHAAGHHEWLRITVRFCPEETVPSGVLDP